MMPAPRKRRSSSEMSVDSVEIPITSASRNEPSRFTKIVPRGKSEPKSITAPVADRKRRPLPMAPPRQTRRKWATREAYRARPRGGNNHRSRGETVRCTRPCCAARRRRYRSSRLQEDAMIKERLIHEVVTPMAATDGAGVLLKRSIATPWLDHLDPFFLFDHFGSEDAND